MRNHVKAQPRPASDARVQAMARILNRAYDTLAEQEDAPADNFFRAELAADLTDAFGDLSEEDQARVAVLCPRAAELHEATQRAVAEVEKAFASISLAELRASL